jgi:hypothetical protein
VETTNRKVKQMIQAQSQSKIDAVLVRLSMSVPGNQHTDSEFTTEFCNGKAMSEDYAAVKVLSFSKEDMLPVTQVRGAIYTRHRELTLPYMRGMAILPLAHQQKYEQEIEIDGTSKFNEVAESWPPKVPGFIAKLALPMEEGGKGNGFKPADYGLKHWPISDTEQALLVQRYQQSFRMQVLYQPFPDSSHFTQFSGQVNEQFKLKLEENFNAQLEAMKGSCMAELWDRLIAPVAHMAEKLSDPKSRVFETVITNIQDILAVAGGLNLTNDPAIEAAIAKIQKDLASSDIELIKSNPIVKAETAAKAAAIVKAFGNFGNRQFVK